MWCGVTTFKIYFLQRNFLYFITLITTSAHLISIKYCAWWNPKGVLNRMSFSCESLKKLSSWHFACALHYNFRSNQIYIICSMCSNFTISIVIDANTKTNSEVCMFSKINTMFSIRSIFFNSFRKYLNVLSKE